MSKIVKAIYNGVEYEINAGGAGIEPRAEMLIVAGGGGGGGGYTTYGGGGGGGGGVWYCPSYPVSKDVTYTVVVGAGGDGGVNCSCNGTRGCPSYVCDSCGNWVMAAFGGYGGLKGCVNNARGGAGGAVSTSSATSDIVYGSCVGGTGGNRAAGGGGSAFSAGQDGGACVCGLYGGDGGYGYYSDISGTMVGYGGGGGGASSAATYSIGGTPGAGGGYGADRCCGHNTIDSITPTGPGGGGGGGLNYNGQCGGNGACGVVIIRYHCDGRDGITCATGGCVYECNDYIIHCFTCDGTFCIVC